MGFNATAGMIIQTFILPIEVFQNVVPAEQARPVGPVAIFNLTDSAVDASVETGQLYPILLLTAILSTALAITNLLPLPALDGGRILFIIIEAIRGKRVSPEKEGAIHFIGLALLLTLMVLISYNDVVNPIEIPDWPGLFR
jgi:regulator of sigma E protease